ncbi:hypothetical protein ACOTH0_01470 [Achromobacter xylosoxidans]|uniref:hypothetical protein n=1 Tax=Achromobacter TaxID=222 RepID=UPI000A8696A6|nr:MULTISPECIES: hypothetical protein [Achromobacter]MBD3841451.1 hypothetical protein [Campylobacterales bacterium]MCH4573596.1 hypothetical protein [Achromobacter xylosoxidans]
MKKKNTKQISDLKNKAITTLLILEQVLMDDNLDKSFKDFSIKSLVSLAIDTANEIVELEIQDDES